MAQQKLVDADDGWNVMRGLCMGCADVVPGVSGGTVALILGIYVRLVTALSRVDRTFFEHGRRRRWRAAAEHVDLRFLLTLAAGIGTGVVTMSLIINRLLTSPMSRSMTLAAFFGMILASAFLIAKLIQPQSRRQLIEACLLGFGAALLAVAISMLQQSNAGEPSPAWLFACGGIAICAMILPGISGAMILLVLGVYVHLTEVPRNLLAGEHIGHSLMTLAVFGSGCLIGLLLFSKVLRWLLTSFYVHTMAILCGFMIGALVKLWPFQEDLTPHVEKFKHKQFRLIWPETLDAQTIAIAVAALLAMAAVFVVDYQTRRTGNSASA